MVFLPLLTSAENWANRTKNSDAHESFGKNGLHCQENRHDGIERTAPTAFGVFDVSAGEQWVVVEKYDGKMKCLFGFPRNPD